MDLMWWLLQDLNAKAFSLLHALDVRLDTADQLLGQSILRDVLVRLGRESLKVDIGAFRFAIDKVWLWSVSDRSPVFVVVQLQDRRRCIGRHMAERV